ncbi:c2h2 finger domain protein [Pyrenophora tritici-repentis]|uniref:Zinc finger protein 622 n=1 Tax=Pyrenophora tritici-repentis TaxID=45151 RepID=A0A2W1GS40_9PLEO|nr:c2h2 finger domain protein [Pyrenophora tritici-repentis]KAF7454693.1 c2h2 finger domain protein [Pyrenophora tritici-repentis]KAF7577823.1 zinc finger protein 622 [Pyrenophora tritici-repentis]KAG9388449.1 c2h2 finger domain protein [Pyrenophora tritici-repentis]KAI0575785.1 c2h2 finger domain protein [Pyrenophora tritici-repentis]
MASQVPTQANIQSTHPFTCNTCQVAFRSSELQRAHMQTDWHRYNLKRRVASLPPLSSEIFTEKVLANKATAAATAAKASFEKVCSPCQKTYFSENAYNNHLNSQKHRMNMAKSGKGAQLDDAASVTGSMVSSAFSLGESMAESETTTVNGDADKDLSTVVDGMKNTSIEEDTPASQSATADDDKSSVATSNKPASDPLLDCLFCNYKSPNFQLNIAHMGRFHGMFIPEKEFLAQPEELIKYLHEKVHVRNECLKCHKMLHTASGIQTHMRDRGHCMIAFDSDIELVEIGEFYDFRSSYPDAADFNDMEEEAEDSDDSSSTTGGGVKLGARRETKITTEDDAAMSSNAEEDAGWETDSTVSSVPTDEITAVPIDRTHRHKSLSKSKHHNHADPRPHRAADGFHSHAHHTPQAVYYDEYELHLPSGRTAGHRSLNKYYRQNLRNYPGVAERMEEAQRLAIPGAITAGDEEDEDEDGDTPMDGEQTDGRQLQVRGRRDRKQQLMSRANGGTGMLGVTDSKKKEIAAVEKRDRQKEQRARTRYQAGNEKRHNFQKHFRDPLLQ